MTHDDSASDSAGLVWHERQLSSTGFDRDDGSADPAVLAVLRDPESDHRLVEVLARARLLVPVVATATDSEPDERGLVHDAGVEMAVVTLTAPDGSRALPVFTSVETLAAWDAAARPVPVTAARAAQSAVAEGCGELVVDLGSDHVRTLRASMVWALAQQRAWAPAHLDEHVAGCVEAALRAEPEVTAYELADGRPPGAGVLQVGLTLRPGLDPEQVRALATRVGERLATDGELRARVDGLAFVIH